MIAEHFGEVRKGKAAFASQLGLQDLQAQESRFQGALQYNKVGFKVCYNIIK